MRASCPAVLSAPIAVVALLLATKQFLGPSVVGFDAGINEARSIATDLDARCESLEVSSITLAIVAAEKMHRDFVDELADIVVSSTMISQLMGYKGLSLGAAQLKPVTLLKNEIVLEEDIYDVTVRMAQDECEALRLAGELIQLLSAIDGSCPTVRMTHTQNTICIIQQYNGQQSLHRQNFAYLGFVQYLTAEIDIDRSVELEG